MRYSYTENVVPSIEEIILSVEAIKKYSTFDDIISVTKCSYGTIIVTKKSIIFPEKEETRQFIRVEEIAKIEIGGNVLIDLTTVHSKIFFIVFSNRNITSDFHDFLVGFFLKKLNTKLFEDLPFIEIDPNELSEKECIICDKLNFSISIEHIIPESLGNKRYVMEKCMICDNCNNRFSNFEEKALSRTIFLMERARLGIATKKDKPSKGKINELNIYGDQKYRKQLINVEGLSKDNLTDYDPVKKTFKLRVKSFDKSEVATSRFLLMIGIESIYTSKISLFNKYDFSELKDYLLGKTNKDWGFITTQNTIGTFDSIPSFSMKRYIESINCRLEIQEKSDNELLFYFKYGGVGTMINLLNRNTSWVKEYKAKFDKIMIFPEHLDK